MTRSLDLSPCSSSDSLSFEEEIACPFFVKVDVGGLIMAAGRLECIGSNTAASNAAQASATTKIPAPAADDVSELLSQFFSNHGRQYQAHAARGAENHRDFVRSLKVAAGEYMTTDYQQRGESSPLEAS